MVSHKVCAAEFAAGADKCTASRMFIRDSMIYSYGEHFPIARWVRADYKYDPRRSSDNPAYYGPKEKSFPLVVINSNGYSLSTTRHINAVMDAVRLLETGPIVLAPGANISQALEFIKTQWHSTFQSLVHSKYLRTPTKYRSLGRLFQLRDRARELLVIPGYKRYVNLFLKSTNLHHPKNYHLLEFAVELELQGLNLRLRGE